jgi:hypothetical protein
MVNLWGVNGRNPFTLFYYPRRDVSLIFKHFKEKEGTYNEKILMDIFHLDCLLLGCSSPHSIR